MHICQLFYVAFFFPSNCCQVTSLPSFHVSPFQFEYLSKVPRYSFSLWPDSWTTFYGLVMQVIKQFRRREEIIQRQTPQSLCTTFSILFIGPVTIVWVAVIVGVARFLSMLKHVMLYVYPKESHSLFQSIYFIITWLYSPIRALASPYGVS
jgi:hypothetical protein